MQKSELLPLTGLRAVAAYTVFASHLLNVYWSNVRTYLIVDTFSYFGMTLFFCLSGFVITYNYADKFIAGYKNAAKHFMLARFARLYPLYLLFLIISIGPILNDKLWRYLTLTQAWTNDYSYTFAHAWSISAEWFFYLVFLMIVPFINKISKFGTALKAAAAVAISGYLYFHLFLNYFPQTQWMQYYSPYANIYTFLIGCMAAKIYMTFPTLTGDIEERYGRITGHIAIAIMAFLFVLNLLYNVPYGYWQLISKNYLYAPIIGIFMVCAARYGTIAILSAPFVVLLGEMSYSIYIIQHWMFALFPSHNWLKVFSSIITTTLFAYGTYSLWEVPWRKLIREKIKIRP